MCLYLCGLNHSIEVVIAALFAFALILIGSHLAIELVTLSVQPCKRTSVVSPDIYACIYVYAYVCMYVCMYVRTYVRAYTHTHTHLQQCSHRARASRYTRPRSARSLCALA